MWLFDEYIINQKYLYLTLTSRQFVVKMPHIELFHMTQLKSGGGETSAVLCNQAMSRAGVKHGYRAA